MSKQEAPLSVLRSVIEAMNSGRNTAGLSNMADDVVIVDDVPPFHRTGLQQAELWFRRLAVARERLDASMTLTDADVRIDEDRAYIVAPGLFQGKLDDAPVDVKGTVTATLIERDGSWFVDGLIWSAGHY